MSPLSEYCPPKTRLRTVICGDSGTSRWEDEFISSNLEWPHKPHRPARLWSHAYGVLGALDLWIGLLTRTGKAARLLVCHDNIINQQYIACSWRLALQWWSIFLVDYVRIHNLLYCIILVSKGHLWPGTLGIALGRTSWDIWDIPRYEGDLWPLGVAWEQGQPLS